MNDFFIRAEDIQESDILSLYVESSFDRVIIDKLKGKMPTIIVGSRGVGKSFLMHVASSELTKDFQTARCLPIYITLSKSSLIKVTKPNTFFSWMMATICSASIRTMKKMGLLVKPSAEIDLLAGERYHDNKNLLIEKIRNEYEDSWRNSEEVDDTNVPTVEDFKSAISEICEELGLKRIVLFIDEAAHVFIREQQEAFFTLFRDLRCPLITCHAAVYPGVTAYGTVFQPKEDAQFVYMNRDVNAADYVEYMRQMIEKQEPESSLLKDISKNGEYFNIVACAASGNPRHLLKIISRLTKFNSTNINQALKEFYKGDMYTEHSELAQKYPALQTLINWGRNFVEDVLVPDFYERNSEALESDPKKTTMCYFWVHQNAPESVKRALNILEYTGLIQEHTRCLKGSHSEIGTRYLLNLGCLFAAEANPLTSAFEIKKRFSAKVFKEFGINNPVYDEIKDCPEALNQNDVTQSLKEMMTKSVNVLDLSHKMKDKLKGLGLNTIQDVYNAPESKLMEAYYVGQKRARQMKAVAMASVYEYLIG